MQQKLLNFSSWPFIKCVKKWMHFGCTFKSPFFLTFKQVRHFIQIYFPWSTCIRTNFASILYEENCFKWIEWPIQSFSISIILSNFRTFNNKSKVFIIDMHSFVLNCTLDWVSTQHFLSEWMRINYLLEHTRKDTWYCNTKTASVVHKHIH